MVESRAAHLKEGEEGAENANTASGSSDTDNDAPVPLTSRLTSTPPHVSIP